MLSFIKKHSSQIYPAVVVLACLLVFIVSLRMNIFRYNNFEFGKFDLGNMTQMVWNTMHGRFMYLTDYFGANTPRWAMSHVDPIMVIFVPIFAIFQSPLTLVISQLILVISSAYLIYLISDLEFKSKPAAVLMALSFLIFPAVGYLLAWTGFHGVTAVIPFFLGAFYVYERMYKSGQFSKRSLVLFWVLLILTMMGKEQLPLYIFVYGLFIWIFRQNRKVGLSMAGVGLVWFLLAFFVLIPAYAPLRVQGYEKFVQALGLEENVTKDVANDNYFLSRYEEFGDSYLEVGFNMLLHPAKLVEVFFSGEKPTNFMQTFAPLGFLPFAYPQLLAVAGIDFVANYATTAGGIGTSEIYNHRVSMIVPVLFISTIFAISYLSSVLAGWKWTKKVSYKHYVLAFSALVLMLNMYTSTDYENPIYLWFTQAAKKRLLGSVALAKTDMKALKEGPKIGESIRVSELESNDRDCAAKVVSMIPAGASVSGPDFLGAHLSMRETYAIFPALYNEADYVIVDVFSRKLATILGLEVTVVREVVGDIMRHPSYELTAGCGNLFVYKRVDSHDISALLPLQEKFEYDEKFNYEITRGLYVVDYSLPQEITRGKLNELNFTYIRKTSDGFDGYVMFMSFINSETGEVYQIANLPAYGVKEIGDWERDVYYLETNDVVIPAYLEPGTYKAFVGVGNKVHSRSLYLGDVEIR
jgi:uncharacterized membrane protein